MEKVIEAAGAEEGAEGAAPLAGQKVVQKEDEEDDADVDEESAKKHGDAIIGDKVKQAPALTSGGGQNGVAVLQEQFLLPQ
jgi:hypothetical protein